MIFSAFKIKKQAHNDRFSDDIDQTEPRIWFPFIEVQDK
jgi:hypothetical protein